MDKPKREILDFAWPRKTADWKNLGNEFIKESADGALLCYDRALSCDEPIGGLTSKINILFSLFFTIARLNNPVGNFVFTKCLHLTYLRQPKICNMIPKFF